MKRAMMSLIMLGALALVVTGCKRLEKPKVDTITVSALAAAMDRGDCTVIDANSTQARTLLGVIPGATLLTHYKEYSLAELPKDRDKPLVFYCANESCGASHVAADRALVAGFSKVKVLPAGVAGWKEAGNPVAAYAIQ